MAVDSEITAAAGPARARPSGDRRRLARHVARTSRSLLHVVADPSSRSLMFFPFLWMIATALRPPGQEADLSLIPRPYLAFENFSRAWNYRGPFPQYTINSFVIADRRRCLAVVLNALAGFAFAKYRFPRARGPVLRRAGDADGAVPDHDDPGLRDDRASSG